MALEVDMSSNTNLRSGLAVLRARLYTKSRTKFCVYWSHGYHSIYGFQVSGIKASSIMVSGIFGIMIFGITISGIMISGISIIRNQGIIGVKESVSLESRIMIIGLWNQVSESWYIIGIKLSITKTCTYIPSVLFRPLPVYSAQALTSKLKNNNNKISRIETLDAHI